MADWQRETAERIMLDMCGAGTEVVTEETCLALMVEAMQAMQAQQDEALALLRERPFSGPPDIRDVDWQRRVDALLTKHA